MVQDLLVLYWTQLNNDWSIISHDIIDTPFISSMQHFIVFFKNGHVFLLFVINLSTACTKHVRKPTKW